jgi:FtsP/CotA-like multicopper oxidase with cupredoxin domain
MQKICAGAALNAVVGVCLPALINVCPAWADKSGCEYKEIDVALFGQKPFQNPPEIVSRNGLLKANLIMQYTNSIAGCPVHLRTYNGQLVGSTLRARPGDVLDIDLDNRLPIESPDQIQAQFEQARFRGANF